VGNTIGNIEVNNNSSTISSWYYLKVVPFLDLVAISSLGP
jgi:hypothetical protein